MCKAMRTIMINTGTELLLGDVLNTHLRFVAREIFPLGLRIERQLSVPDGAAIGEALAESMAFDLVFVTGGLGPTTDDVTREAIAELLGLEFEENAEIANGIRHRLTSRGWKLTDRILRQALVPKGATILPNHHGTAPGLYFPKNPATAFAAYFCVARSAARATPDVCRIGFADPARHRFGQSAA